MSIVCFVQKAVMMGVVNLAITTFMVLTIIIFAKIKSTRALARFVVVFIYALMIFFLTTGGAGGVSIMWLLFVPAAATYFISLYYGGVLSILLGISVSVYMFTPLHFNGYPYSEQQIVRFPIIYWAFTITSLIIAARIDRAEEKQKEIIELVDKLLKEQTEEEAKCWYEQLEQQIYPLYGLSEEEYEKMKTSLVKK
jgi:hypothetical protein